MVIRRVPVRAAPPPPPRRLAPRLSGSRPDQGWPSPKNRVRANRVTIGMVYTNTTSRSMTVERPRVKAKPCTEPTVSSYRTTAAISVTMSEAMIVRRARIQPWRTAERSDLPSRSSSRNRSKNTTKESAVIPMATIRPATPSSERVKPISGPNRQASA